MNQLIKVEINNNQEPVVSGRELHEFLEVGTHFKDWFPRMVEYGFEENRDYTPLIFEHPQNGQPTKDYAIKIDMAKEIAMIQRNEKGKQARQYFLAVEKELNSPERVMARALKIADKTINQLKIENEAMKPKALFADAVSQSDTSILIGQFAKILNQNGFDIGQNRLFAWMRKNKYLMDVGSNRNVPSQNAMDMKLFEIKETAIFHCDGHSTVSITSKLTGKGQLYFMDKFMKMRERGEI